VTAAEFGYVLLGLSVAGQSMGAPLPGESALIAAAALAAAGQASIVIVLAVAAGAAVAGGVAGYGFGRSSGRWLLERPGLGARRRALLLASGERFFARHGAKAVFLGRWITALRITAAPLAGINRMRWRAFMLWNTLGGVLWPVSVGLVAFFVGKRFVILAGLLALAGLGVAAVAYRRHSARTHAVTPARASV
jgi:membrane protein DedA with SNARE-associated domain